MLVPPPSPLHTPSPFATQMVTPFVLPSLNCPAAVSARAPTTTLNSVCQATVDIVKTAAERFTLRRCRIFHQLPKARSHTYTHTHKRTHLHTAYCCYLFDNSIRGTNSQAKTNFHFFNSIFKYSSKTFRNI